jgi:CSLREA domain-containing protein
VLDAQQGGLERFGVPGALRVGSCALLVALSLLLLLAPAGWAATISVDTTKDLVAADGHCSLREAITAANNDTATPGAGECPAGSGADTIILPAGSYVLSRPGAEENQNQTGDLDIADELTILGAGTSATIIDANGIDRVLQVLKGRVATIEGVTLTGGRTADGRDGFDKAGREGTGSGEGEKALGEGGHNGGIGGGILNAGSLTLVNCTVAGNATGNGGDGGNGYGGFGGSSGGKGGSGFGGNGGNGGDGGGIYDTGVLTLVGTAVTKNSTGAGGNGGEGIGGSGGVGGGAANGGFGGFGGEGGRGGGIYEREEGELIIERSTITANSTGVGGNGAQGLGGDAGGGGSSGSITGGAGGDGVGGFGGLGGWGGGIAALDPMILTDDLIAGNHTGGGGQASDGIGGKGGPGGSPNGAGGVGGAGLGGFGGGGGWGGGIYSAGYPPRPVFTNVTITANATGAGAPGGEGVGGAGGPGQGGGNGGAGGIAIAGFGGEGGRGGAVADDALLTLVNATVTANAAATGGSAGAATPGAGGSGGSSGKGGSAGEAVSGEPGRAGAAALVAVYETPKHLTLQNSIVAGNTPANCVAPESDGGHDISFPDATCAGANVDPQLLPLADNGGPTLTQALGPLSPAIDAVPAVGAGCPATDQRGVSRPQGPACDIGAFEVAVSATSSGGGGSSGTNNSGSSGGGVLGARVASMTDLRETHARFAVARKPTPLSAATAKRHPRGTTFSFTLDIAATVRIAIVSMVAGRRSHGRCVRTSQRLRRQPKCTRKIAVGTLTRTAHAGSNSVPFSGRIGSKALKRGHYEAVFTAVDPAGASARHSLRFTVVAR